MAEDRQLNPMALSAEQAANTLRVPPEWIREDIDAGAPTNADGTINLIQYAAWLNMKMREDGDGEA